MFSSKHRLVVLFLFVAVLAPLALLADIPLTQRQALIALYNSTNGDSWSYNTGWKTPPFGTDGFALPGTEGTWYGVTVEADNVTWISLGGNVLVGTIPAALGNLTALQMLNLSSNQLSGSIPPELGNLSALQQIFLSYNQLTGTIPAELGNLTALRNLYLPYNQLTGTIPAELGNLTSLEQFWLSGNQLSGSIPTTFGNLTKMQILHLDNCGLGGPLPAGLGNMVDLTELLLYNSLYSGSLPPELGNLKKLQRFWLASNQIEGAIPPELGGMTALYDLQLGGNKLSGPIPAELGNLTNLTSLVLYVNQLTGPIPIEIGNLTKLATFHVSSNKLSGAIPASFWNLTNLVNVSFMNNDFTGQLPVQLGNLTKLTTLDLRYNHFSGPIPTSIGNLTSLIYLYLNGNQLSGPIPTSMMNLINLSPYVDIGYNALYTSDTPLITFLNSKDPDWAATQTIALSDVTATAFDGAIMLVSWSPIAYTGHTGYYKIYQAQTPGGPYTLAGQTEDKSAASAPISGLTPGQTYYFVVQTHTDPHNQNYLKNAVESEYSAEASAVAWMQVDLHVSGTITAGGSPLAGVVMNGLTGSPVTNASGFYQGSEAAGWSGTVAPSLEGYTFTPTSRTYTGITADQTGQDYAATPIAAPTVTSPNGGETWAMGTAHNVTWTQMGLTGTVTVDLYKGGVYQKTLGTPAATAGTFPWIIASTETAGTDFRIRIWQTGSSDDSDADFAIVRRLKVDFNKDGQEDILWRYYGTGEGQGDDVVWFMSQTGALSPMTLGGTKNMAGTMNAAAGSAPRKTYLTPMDVGNSRTVGPGRTYVTPMDVGNSRSVGPGKTYVSPMDVGNPVTPKQKKLIRGTVDLRRGLSRGESVPIREKDLKGDPVLQDPEKLLDGSAKTMALDYSDANLYTVLDTTWEIAGAGDFNGDGNTDIVWRYYGVGEGQGTTIIWFMNGTTIASQGYPYQVSDTNWRIDRTGDFNGDGKADILWRYYGAGGGQGTAIIWLMDGANVIGQAYPYQVLDTDWKIEGIGDFDGDGRADLVWRYYGTGPGAGTTIIWYMDGTTIIGQGHPYLISDTDWKIDTVGDFNGDGRADLVWRYYGVGGGLGTTIIWYMDGATLLGQDRTYRVPDTNWRIVNR